MGSKYVQYVRVISANVPCRYYVHRDMYEVWYVHVLRYILGQKYVDLKCTYRYMPVP